VGQTGEAGPVDSQKVTSVLPATLAEVRVAWKVHRSAWLAVMLSPVQAVGIRCPVAVYPARPAVCLMIAGGALERVVNAAGEGPGDGTRTVRAGIVVPKMLPTNGW
jgi:hypothetical protein